MKKLNEKELVEVKGGFADPTVSFFALNDITINKKHRNHFNWKKIFETVK
ncbi:hypothetical protein [Lactobacillus crispatus]|uniref:Bacteriocin n=1 Tax=Lactobacillus crispatus TaxID=47770 RepID=A0ABV2BA12_9LACO|nr:hypothetical protein [Lactobacillus crispatus]